MPRRNVGHRGPGTPPAPSDFPPRRDVTTHGPKAPDLGGLPLTDAAERLLLAAGGESARLRHEYIGTEHLALALTDQSGDDALLARVGVDPGRVRTLLEGAVPPGAAPPLPTMARPYTTRTHTAFTLAGECARTLGHAHVDVEHLVAGMLRERRNVGAQTLEHLGVTDERVLDALRRRDAAAGGG